MSVTGDELLAHLKRMEGFVGHPYIDAAGYLTLGYGHRITKAESRNLTEDEATQLLVQDIGKYTMAAVRLSPLLVRVSPRRLNAVIDFCFNLGSNAYALSTLKKKVDREDWPGAAAENAKWVYIRNPQTGVRAVSSWLKKRRAITSGWFLAG